MKRKIIFTILLAMIVSALAIAVSATVEVSYDLKEVSTSAGAAYRVVATLNDDEGDFRGWSNVIQFDYNMIKPVNKSTGAKIDIATASTVALKRAPLNKYNEYSDDYGDDITPSWTETSWTANGAESKLVFKTLLSDPDALGLAVAQDVMVFEFTFMLADGYTVDDFTADTFKIVEIEYPNGNNNFYGKTDGKTNNIVVTNNVVPEAVAITIPVAAGDIVYLQDGTTVVMADANAAYEVPATVGYVAVNTGKSAQKTYYVDGTAATEVHENAVVGSDSLTLRGPDELYNGEDRSGIRFKMTSSQSSRVATTPHNVLEAGFLMTALSDKVVAGLGANPELTMDKVAGGLVLKGVAYDKANNIDIRMDSDDETINIIGVLYGIPVTEAGVQTKIISRPYYKVGDACIYGEATETTLYDVAVAIKGNDDSWEACSSDMQNYINTIIAQVVGWTEIVEDEIVIDISDLYN